MKTLRATLVIATLALGEYASHAGADPVTSWPAASPAALGIDGKRLQALDADIARDRYPMVDGMLVIRCGKIAFQRRYPHDYARIYQRDAGTKGPLNARGSGPYNYFDARFHPWFQGSDQHTMQSVTKTITSVVFGVARTRGDFKAPPDTPVLKYFDASVVRNVDARKRRMTLQNVLTMTAGLDWNEDLPYDDPRNSGVQMEATDDWVAFVINRPMQHEPGTVFVYNSGASLLLAHIFKQETGQDLEAYARRYLFAPLGIDQLHWKRSPSGLVDTEGGLYLRPQDLAKIGFLYLHDGVWEGKRIVSADWIERSVTPQIDAGDGWKYGFQWWLLPRGKGQRPVWAARGFGGQNLFVVPDADLILVLNGWDILGKPSFESAALEQVSGALRPHACGSDGQN